MPNIYDNIDLLLLPTLQGAMNTATHADFCVGYFNLRGWKELSACVEPWSGGAKAQARVLVGMQRLPQEEARRLNSFLKRNDDMDGETARRFKQTLAIEFRKQLEQGPSKTSDQKELLRLAEQLEAKKVAVKLHCRHALHAKLYLLHLKNTLFPQIGFLGSSNLTYSGLGGNGELNVDVKEDDACLKLSSWFNERWDDRFSLDISAELAEILRESWIVPRSPYHVYLKMAYHLSQEAREGEELFSLPHPFDTKLFKYQGAAVKMAARNLNKRGGVIIGDVVGLGKTVMACAVAKIFTSAPYHLEVLVICPASLVKMWENASRENLTHLKVVSFDKFLNSPPDAAYRLVIIDESHNLRSGTGARYTAIEKYLKEKSSKVLLLSATPYNKTYLDLSKQLRLFIEPDKSIGIKPENFFKANDEAIFRSTFGVNADTLAAFEKSPFPDDWRELMRLYLVRRTRSFILKNYAQADGDRRFLEYPNGSRFYFPTRCPKTLQFPLDEKNPHDQFARLYSSRVVDAINALHLPRYGLGQYIDEKPKVKPTAAETEQLDNLGRAGKRLMGFCRTNLFKRLESSGEAFLLSIERHIARNCVFLHALQNDLPLPIGTQNADILDAVGEDLDFDGDETELGEALSLNAQGVYDVYAAKKSGFRWIRADLFQKNLTKHLTEDNAALGEILKLAEKWDAKKDAKLTRLKELLGKTHANEKVLVFSQFADTVHYLERELKIEYSMLGAATGQSADPTELARRFSPVSNNFTAKNNDELRVLIATDVLSEGQNLQDAHVIVNYDLPWAIIRLIQRAGRVDRIGQNAPEILCYSFLPAEGVEKIIKLRSRLMERLDENAGVVGTDERFFEDEARRDLLDLYHEKSDMSGDDGEGEVDLPSRAYAIWKSATEANPELLQIIPNMPDKSNAAREVADGQTRGALVYTRLNEETDAMSWIDENGETVTTGQWTILQATACSAATKGLEVQSAHHDLVSGSVMKLAESHRQTGIGLGSTSGARFKTYGILTRFYNAHRGPLNLYSELGEISTLMQIKPFCNVASNQIKTQLKLNANDAAICNLLMDLHKRGALFPSDDDNDEDDEPRLVCSIALV